MTGSSHRRKPSPAESFDYLKDLARSGAAMARSAGSADLGKKLDDAERLAKSLRDQHRKDK